MANAGNGTPVTRSELRQELKRFATRDELRQELKRFATKDELRQELKRFATKDELRQELKRFATKDELRQELKRFATKKALAKVAAQTRRNTEAIAKNTEAIAKNTESIRLLSTQMSKVHDRLDRIEATMATKAQLDTLISAVDMYLTRTQGLLEKHLVHDDRLKSLETRADDHEGRLKTLEGDAGTPHGA